MNRVRSLGGILGNRVAQTIKTVEIIACAADHRIRAGTAIERVIAGGARERVIADPAGETVIPGIAGNGIIETIAKADKIAGACKRQRLDIDERRSREIDACEELGAELIPPFVGVFDDYCVGDIDSVNVIAEATGERIRIGPAIERIIAQSANKRIEPARAVQGVIPGPARDRIIRRIAEASEIA